MTKNKPMIKELILILTGLVFPAMAIAQEDGLIKTENGVLHFK